MLLNKLINDKVLFLDPWIPSNTVYLSLHGSHAYHTNGPDSDRDYIGICVPPIKHAFPHLAGELVDFGRPAKRFLQYETLKKIIWQKDEYEFKIYSIVRFCHLALTSINILEALFSPSGCINHITSIGHSLRENRRLFLSKKIAYSIKSYAHGMMHKAVWVDRIGSRKVLVDKFGADVKALSHCVRLTYEAEQILKYNDLDLTANNEHIKAVKRGEVDPEDVRKWYAEREIALEKLMETSKIREEPPEGEIRSLLVGMLEHHYGDLSTVIKRDISNSDLAVAEIRGVLGKYNF